MQWLTLIVHNNLFTIKVCDKILNVQQGQVKNKISFQDFYFSHQRREFRPTLVCMSLCCTSQSSIIWIECFNPVFVCLKIIYVYLASLRQARKFEGQCSGLPHEKNCRSAFVCMLHLLRRVSKCRHFVKSLSGLLTKQIDVDSSQ